MKTTPGSPHPTDDVLDALTVLETHGYAWAVFSPAELGGADPEHCRDAMIETGWDYITSEAAKWTK